MSNPYGEIFRAPGARGFAAAGFFARLPIAMAPIGIVAMLSQTRGEYWLAGAVAATYGIANALIAPQLSRIIDRRGQSAVIIPATIVSALAFVALALAANQDWPVWTLFATALMAAFLPSMPALVRARWTEIFRNRPELNTAFAFESAADELVYIAGASLSVGLAVSLFPEAGILISTTFLVLGTLAFVAQRKTEPAIRPVGSAGPARAAITYRPVQIIALALVFVGAIFGTTEVSVVAITEMLGQAGAATPVIGVYAVGSFVVGLILGAVNPKLALHRQLLIAVAILAITAWPLLWAGDVLWLGGLVFLSGVAISPTFITAFGLIERRVPEAVLTEGVTWVTTGISIGMALGASITGWVVDSYGAANGFWVSVAASAAAVLTVALGQGALAAERGQASHAQPQPAQ